MKRALTLLIAALAAVSCAKGPSSERIGSSAARSGGAAPGATTTASGITLNGIVHTDAQNQTLFQQAVGDFMEAVIDPQYIGYVSATGDQQTGVLAGGLIKLSNGAGVTVGTTQASIDPSSELFISVYDKFADQTNLAPLPPIYFHGTAASGTVSGNTVNIKFQDTYGWVQLQGQFDSQKANLTFTFETTRTWDGRTGYGGTLGTLTVPTCQFFRCQ